MKAWTVAGVRIHRPQPGYCAGRCLVFPVPPGMTVGEALAEARTLGRLHPYAGTPTWTPVRCPGGAECVCAGIEYSRAYRHYHHGRLVEATPLGLLEHLVGLARRRLARRRPAAPAHG